MKARARLTYWTVSAMAWAMLVSGWKYSFIRAVPWTLRDSTWWMPLMYRKWYS
jgi:hypothetical protein